MEIFIRDVLNKPSNEFKSRTRIKGNFVVKVFVFKRKSNRNSIKINNTRLSNDGSFKVTSNVSNNFFKAEAWSRRVDVEIKVFSSGIFVMNDTVPDGVNGN